MKTIASKIISLSIGINLIVVIPLTSFFLYSTYQEKMAELVKVEKMLLKDFDEQVKYQVEAAITILKKINENIQNKRYTLAEGKKIAAEMLRSIRYGVDGYIYVYTNEGITVINPGNLSTEGVNRIDLKDTKGNYIIKTFIEQAKQGGGYSDYWTYAKLPSKSGGKEEVQKRSYTVPFEPFDWVLGTGNYIMNIQKEVGVYKERIFAELNSAIYKIIAIFIAALIVSILISVLFGRTLAKPIAFSSSYVEALSSGDIRINTSSGKYLKMKDEIGRLSNNIQRMVQYLNSIVEEIKSSSEIVA